VTNRPVKKQLSIAIVVFLLFAGVEVFHARGDDSDPSKAREIKLFLAADDSSEVLATLKNNERYVPLAEILGSDGNKWYLIKIESGAMGWTRESDKAVAQKLDSYFKPVPVELSFPQPRELSSSPSGASPGNRITVPVESNGSSVIVRVIFNGSLTANLYLDTGATYTTVSKRIARSLGLSAVGSARMASAAGVIMTPMTRLRSIKVGEAEASNLLVSIHDFSQDARVEGLLGLNFLNQFEFSIDARKRQLFLTPR
jgi:predicted aspartyl protease